MNRTYPAKLVGDWLRTERQPDGTRILLRQLDVEVDSIVIEVPEGTSTDFSTIPWYGRILVRWSRVDIAGVVHDYLYHKQMFSRARADRIWRLCAVSGEHHAISSRPGLGGLRYELAVGSHGTHVRAESIRERTI